MLVEQHAARCHRIACAIIGETDAGDATQDALVAAWRQLPRLRDPDRFGPWLGRIVVNRCRNILRQRSRRPSSVALDAARELASSSPDLRDQVETRMVLDRAFERLTFDQRAVLALHYAAGLALSEVAQVLGVPDGTVKSRLAAGLARLRAALADAS